MFEKIKNNANSWPYDLENLKDFDFKRSNYSITDNEIIDNKIIDLALEKGYQIRPFPLKEDKLEIVDDRHYLQPQAVQAYKDLKNKALNADYDLYLISAFRNYNHQRNVFLKYLKQPYLKKDILERLKTSAPPGFSKHHTGYTIDITQRGFNFEDFAQSPLYRWLAENNFQKALECGWIPSYPNTHYSQGPEPEPWEFIYVGHKI